jgi:hypothetical protein
LLSQLKGLILMIALQLKELQNENINMFMGMDLEFIQEIVVMWNFCSRGSLRVGLINVLALIKIIDAIPGHLVQL